LVAAADDMSLTPLDSPLYGNLLSDEEAASLLDAKAEIAAFLKFEAALAAAEAEAGVIPGAAADAIAEVTGALDIDPASLGEGTARDGVPIPALVTLLRGALPKEAAPYVHWGATSQDVTDSGLVLRLRDFLELAEGRLTVLGDLLAQLADRHRGQVMLGRTRMQQAAPTTFGLKAAIWLSALTQQRQRLMELRSRLLTLSVGGAVGTLSVLGARAEVVERGLAERLGLSVAPIPWHAERGRLLELGGWLSQTTVALGKMGQDLVLLAQNEVGEVRLQGGGSSTMPNKVNPVSAEALVTLARFNAAQLGLLHQAGVQGQERGGAGWMLEWLTLPPMLLGCAGALSQAQRCLEGLEIDPGRMQGNFEAALGLPLAESVSFALAEVMPRQEAQALVKEVCRRALNEQRDLLDVLAENSDLAVDFAALRDPARWLGSSDRFIGKALAEWRDRG
jgi:3-carboxy-cis,cis-muconate cycloisomerase